MSWVGTMIGLPWAGLRMLLVLIISTRASICASMESGTCTAIWSPSKSALKAEHTDRKSTRLNSSHGYISYAVFCLKKKKQLKHEDRNRNQLLIIHRVDRDALRCLRQHKDHRGVVCRDSALLDAYVYTRVHPY